MNGEDEPGVRPGPPTMSRRTALGLGAAVLAGATLGLDPVPASARAAAGTTSAIDGLRPAINPREAWGADLPVVGPILAEEDVRFLLVHHTASANDYGPDEVVGQIRDFYAFHTGPEKGWPDVAYNFFVDRFGGIWEARAGSLAGPVRGDATGGSQGHALLCSLIGDHSQVPPSDAARDSLAQLLAWLGEWHGIDTEPGATVSFVSRGSNRWPEGSAVTAATISGHRDMSQTSCPGDFAYDLLAVDLPRAVTDLRLEARASLASTTTAAPTTAVPATVASTTTAPTTGPQPSAAEDAAAGESGAGSGVDRLNVAVGGLAALGAAGLAAAALRNRGRARG